MQILVTGSAGKIGSVVVPALEGAGHEVVTYDTANGQDIHDTAKLGAAMVGCDQVVHLAGIPGPTPDTPFARFYWSNVQGTYNVAWLAVAHGVKRLTYAGSTAFYGVEPGIPFRSPVKEGDPPFTCYVQADELNCQAQHLAYDVSKIMAEQILAYFGLSKQIEVAVPRFGPVKPGRGTTLPAVAEAILRIVEHPGPFWYEIYNIVDENISWADGSKGRELLG